MRSWFRSRAVAQQVLPGRPSTESNWTSRSSRVPDVPTEDLRHRRGVTPGDTPAMPAIIGGEGQVGCDAPGRAPTPAIVARRASPVVARPRHSRRRRRGRARPSSRGGSDGRRAPRTTVVGRLGRARSSTRQTPVQPGQVHSRDGGEPTAQPTRGTGLRTSLKPVPCPAPGNRGRDHIRGTPLALGALDNGVPDHGGPGLGRPP